MFRLFSEETSRQFCKSLPGKIFEKNLRDFLKISKEGFLNRSFEKFLDEFLKQFLMEALKFFVEIYGEISKAIHARFSKRFFKLFFEGNL